MRNFLYILIVLTVAACSPYQQIVKKGTPQEKLEAARKYHAKEDYLRALPLLEELKGLYYNSKDLEDVIYLLASSYFGNEEFFSAGYYFKYFADTYSRSPKREEAEYMSAVCTYRQSMPHELDQTPTKNAINAFQAFINKYPNSPYVAKSNDRIDELRQRLLVKVYENAKLYYSLGFYKSAMVACQNAVDDYPDMIKRDELSYLVCDAAYLYAKNSIDRKQQERYESALEKCNLFLKEFDAEDPYTKEVAKIIKKIKSSSGYEEQSS